jgi:heme/copper-type cytochrome/quinol oxidase subunit 1
VGPNPWAASGLEWQTESPPPTHNFVVTPIVTSDVYAYDAVLDSELARSIATPAVEPVLVSPDV